MKKPHAPAIRAVLREHADGLTTAQLMQLLPQISNEKTLRKCLDAMPDAYIDRWTKTRNCRGQFLAIWCVVDVPDNCPYPTDRFEKPHTVWQEART